MGSPLRGDDNSMFPNRPAGKIDKESHVIVKDFDSYLCWSDKGLGLGLEELFLRFNQVIAFKANRVCAWIPPTLDLNEA